MSSARKPDLLPTPTHGLNGRTDELAKMLHRLLLTTQNASKTDQLEVIIAPTLHDMLHHQLD